MRRRFTDEEWQEIGAEYARLHDRAVYCEYQQSFNPGAYLEYLRANPNHQSNMRAELEAQDRMQRELQLNQWRNIVGDDHYQHYARFH